MLSSGGSLASFLGSGVSPVSSSPSCIDVRNLGSPRGWKNVAGGGSKLKSGTCLIVVRSLYGSWIDGCKVDHFHEDHSIP